MMAKISERWKRVLLALTAFCLVSGMVLVCAPAAQSDEDNPLKEFQEKQKELEAQKEAQQQKIKDADAQLEQYHSQLATLDASISAAENELAYAEQMLSLAETQLAETQLKLEQTIVKLENRTHVFKERLRETYINGQITILDAFFEADTMGDFLTRYYYLESIMDYDMGLIDDIEATKAQIEQQKLEEEEKRDNLEGLTASRQQAVDNLAAQKAQKEQLVAAAENDKATAQKAYDEMDAESEKISAEIKKIQQEMAARGEDPVYNGVMSWPLPGYYTITSEYGMRIHPTLKTRRMHTGIDIAAPNGTTIRCASDGVVIVAQWNNAYGNMAIVSHGDGLTTLYGHMSRTAVSKGQAVSAGDTIGYVGSTGWSTGNHLHFEVQKNGSSVSPWNYVK